MRDVMQNSGLTDACANFSLFCCNYLIRFSFITAFDQLSLPIFTLLHFQRPLWKRYLRNSTLSALSSAMKCCMTGTEPLSYCIFTGP